MSTKNKSKNKAQKEKWFKPSVHTGWKHTLPAKTRRELVLKAHGNDVLASARGLNALSNVTRQKNVKLVARADAQYFFEKYRKEKGK